MVKYVYRIGIVGNTPCAHDLMTRLTSAGHVVCAVDRIDDIHQQVLDTVVALEPVGDTYTTEEVAERLAADVIKARSVRFGYNRSPKITSTPPWATNPVRGRRRGINRRK